MFGVFMTKAMRHGQRTSVDLSLTGCKSSGVIDPELKINIVDLDLIHSINHTDRKAQAEMVLTSLTCRAADHHAVEDGAR